MEHTIKMDDLGVPFFLETPIISAALRQMIAARDCFQKPY